MSVTEDVNIKVSADTAEAVRAWKEIADGPQALAAAMERLGDLEHKYSTTVVAALEGVVAKWTSIHAIIDRVTTAAKAYLDIQNQLRDESVTASHAVDAGLVRYRTAQGNLSYDDGQDAANKILGQAYESGATTPEAFDAASLLARYGVGRKEAEGASLAALLQAQDVFRTQGDADPMSMSRSLLDALQRSQRPINGQSIQSFAQAIHGLSTQIKGFDAGEIGITGDVATYGQKAGLGIEETAAIVGIFSEQFGEGQAGKRFRRLFGDDKYTRDETKQIEQLRQQAAQLLRTGGTSYAGASAIVDESMESKADASDTAYTASGYDPKALDSDEVRKRLITAFRESNGGRISPFEEGIRGMQYDWNEYFWGPEQAVNSMTSGFTGEARSPRMERIRGQALGQIPLKIQLQGPSGMDIPTETPVEQIGDPGAPAGF